ETSQEPILAQLNEEVYIDCKVKDIANYTVLWRFIDPLKSPSEGEILTAGNVRVTSDTRFSVLHRPEENLWLLRINKVFESDAGIYVCEVNSIPRLTRERQLRIEDNETIAISLEDVNHNYTECCAEENVPSECFNFCYFKSLVSERQPTPTVHKCIKHLSSITKCLADGRNHMPCCQKQNIPAACRPVCVGNFSLSTVADHFICMDYAAPILACIAEGVQTLPPQPKNVIVEPISKSELLVRWDVVESLKHLIDGFEINVTQLHSFDQSGIVMSNNAENATPSMFGLEMRFKVNANATEYRITSLKPYTMYEITMNAFNKMGTSLTTNAIRTLTLSDSDLREVTTEPNGHPEPELPNIKKCCRDNGVSLGRCVDILCDPVRADESSVTDFMICAPWANITFKCLSSNIDHTECCEKRGVSENCLHFCSGKVDRLDFRQFVCLEHMSTYSSCILDHYGVLPSNPESFMVSSVHHDWAILKWKPPKKLAHTVIGYHIFWRESAKDAPTDYKALQTIKSPFLLEKLEPEKRYEVYVVAVNQYGVSQPSPRVLFSTPPITPPEEAEEEAKNPAYNETACCVRANMKRKCLPLCSYKVKVDDIMNLAASCADTLQTIIRCGAGGRNHVPCCRKRNVNNGCLNLCAGLIDSSPFLIAARCVDDIGKMIQCMEEGSGLLPGMPVDFHATKVTKNSVYLAWKPAPEDGDGATSIYQVRYGKTPINSPLHPLDHDKSQNSTETKAVIKDLEPSTLYSFYVVAANSYGISLPSLVLLINTSSDESKSNIHSNIGPPHEIEILRKGVDSITFRWLPPLFVPPDSSVSYIVHYKAINGTEADLIPNVTKRWISVETPYNTMIITNLTYDTQYAITIQSKTDKNATSAFSEVVLVWTDPAIPAAVNIPVIIPAGPIVEGSVITVMCVGMGIPTPTVSLYVNGFLMKKDSRRHIALTIPNVQRNLTSITCVAVNGYGKDRKTAQSTLEVRVRYKPVVIPYTKVTSAHEGGPSRIQCQVSGNPQPKVLWFKGKDASQIEKGENIDFVSVSHSELPSTWINTLLIRKTSSDDFGDYTCSAVNDQGQSRAIVTLQQDHSLNYSRNASACCKSQGVSEKCLSVCTFDVNIDKALTMPSCYQEIDKLMICAAGMKSSAYNFSLKYNLPDGSDHRQCCRKKQVPAGCLRWCAGLKLTLSLCALSSVKDIVSCFEEGKILLPGPPRDVHIKDSTKENKVIIEWNPPDKNPELVEFYRVFWRPVGSRDLSRNQTENLHFEITNLEPDKMYEFVVKAGNHYGLSTFTDPLVIPSHNWVAASSTVGSRLLKVFFGLLIAVLLIVCGVLAVLYAYKYYYLPKKAQNSGVSFENPSYLKDGTVQIHDSPRRSNQESENGMHKNMNGAETFS
ncbi:Ig-like and fibronectin type-III domain-containing protein C25G4.10-like protein, partial [Dinothrombium tinctorium]